MSWQGKRISSEDSSEKCRGEGPEGVFPRVVIVGPAVLLDTRLVWRRRCAPPFRSTRFALAGLQAIADSAESMSAIRARRRLSGPFESAIVPCAIQRKEPRDSRKTAPEPRRNT